MISFVIYFHSRRTDNLRQMLRLLFSREKSEKEVVLVCNDETKEEFPGCKVLNMNLSEYRKPKMCNAGVQEAKGEIVALLDSDRILPTSYFGTNSAIIKRGEFVSCEKILKLSRPHTDEEIENEILDFEEDFRSKTWEIRKKNLFSGNTLFYKNDYMLSGGMDESFVGYGFADNDMTRNVVSKGFKAVWRKEEEIHLYHPQKVMEKGKIVGFDEYRKTSQKNLCRFLRKWKMTREYNKQCGCLL